MKRPALLFFLFIITGSVHTADDLSDVRKRAMSGDAAAQVELGQRYRRGNGVENSDVTAVEWFRKAAEQEHGYAQYLLARAYQQGEAVARDDVEAAKWMRKAADQGVIKAQGRLGTIYALGRGVPQSYEEANKWFQVAADKGDRYAEYYLGVSYYMGNAVQQDHLEASRWFRKSAEKGFAPAQERLGGMYLRGYGVPKDEVEAAARFLEAAKQGHSNAQYFLGLMHQDGRGVPLDPVEAYAWLSLAAAAGHERAPEKRDAVAAGLTEIQLTDARQRISAMENLILRSSTELADRQPKGEVGQPGHVIAGNSSGSDFSEQNVEVKRPEYLAIALLILLITALLVFYSVLVYRRVKSWLAERMEMQYHGYRQSRPVPANPGPVQRWMPFRIAIATNLVVAGIAWLVAVYHSPDPSNALIALITGDYGEFLTERNRLTWPFLIPVIVFYFLAYREHVLPGTTRQRKYDFVLAGVICFWIGSSFFQSVLDGTTSPLMLQLLAGLLSLTLVPGILAGIVPVEKPPGRIAKNVYVFLKVSTPAIVFLFLVAFTVPWIFIPYLLLRFLLMGWMEKYPIVYLRSFSQQSAPQVFRKIVSKECNRVGVLVALVHSTQTGTQLRGGSPIHEGSKFEAVGDEQWQAWVGSQLKVAQAVIIDDTVETSGVSWEIEHAQQNFDPERIAILRSKNSAKARYPGIYHIEYEENMREMKKNRRQLRGWLASVLTKENT